MFCTCIINSRVVFLTRRYKTVTTILTRFINRQQEKGNVFRRVLYSVYVIVSYLHVRITGFKICTLFRMISVATIYKQYDLRSLLWGGGNYRFIAPYKKHMWWYTMSIIVVRTVCVLRPIHTMPTLYSHWCRLTLIYLFQTFVRFKILQILNCV